MSLNQAKLVGLEGEPVPAVLYFPPANEGGVVQGLADALRHYPVGQHGGPIYQASMAWYWVLSSHLEWNLSCLKNYVFQESLTITPPCYVIYVSLYWLGLFDQADGQDGGKAPHDSF